MLRGVRYLLQCSSTTRITSPSAASLTSSPNDSSSRPRTERRSFSSLVAGGCVALGNLDNAADGQIKLATGSFSGVLRIYMPREPVFRVEDVLLEQALEQGAWVGRPAAEWSGVAEVEQAALEREKQPAARKRKRAGKKKRGKKRASSMAAREDVRRGREVRRRGRARDNTREAVRGTEPIDDDQAKQRREWVAQERERAKSEGRSSQIGRAHV